MIEPDRLISAVSGRERDEQLDRAIRPLKLADYIGQPSVREQMELFIHAARGRQEALDHTLIFGPPGLGKTTWRISSPRKWAFPSRVLPGRCSSVPAISPHC